MSFNMADLLNEPAKRSITTTGLSNAEHDDEIKHSSNKRVKIISPPKIIANQNKTTHVELKTEDYTNDVVIETTDIKLYEDDVKTSDAVLYRADSPTGVTTNEAAKKKPYGGRPLKFKCQHCDRRFHAPSHLKRHVMSHSSERPFRCDVCDKGFLQAWHLGRHMTTHTGNKPFHCSECPRSFGSRFEMKTHINYIHRGIKEHQCNVCGKHFTLRSNLKVHMRKHTGEKPYKCSFCSKRFGQRGHLQYHIRKHTASIDNYGNADDQSVDSESLPGDDKNEFPSQCYSTKDSVTMASESDKDSGVDSCDYQSTTSSCSSPSIKDFDDQNSPTHFDEKDSKVNCNPIYVNRRGPFYPEYFGASLNSRRQLKQFVCDMCNCGFESMSSLKSHVRHSHPKKGISVGRYKCAICLEDFNTIDALQIHAYVGHQTSPIPVKRTSIFFPSAKQIPSHSSRQSEKSLAFSVERLCQPESKPTSKVQPQSCLCCKDYSSESAKTSLVMPHQMSHGKVSQSYRTFIQMQESLRSTCY